MSYSIKFRVQVGEDGLKTIDPESVSVSGVPPVGEDITVNGHHDDYTETIGAGTGPFWASATFRKSSLA